MLTLTDWHKRYQQQARWTRELRRYIYDRSGLKNTRRVLEVGCGTGVLLQELSQLSQASVYGVDIDRERLVYANTLDRNAILIQGNGLQLPFPSKIFDLVICHYLLLWVSDPLLVLQEMARVVQPGGAVCALAEPDYGGRIDAPTELGQLGDLQRHSLSKQGANVEMGRKLRGLFSAVGLKNVESGVLSAQWSKPPSAEEVDLEWEVLRSDLQGQIPEPELRRLQSIDQQAWAVDERVLYIPTFYAWGRVTNH